MSPLKFSKASFSPKALAAFSDWAMIDPKIVVRIHTLIKDIQHSGLLEGIGKPERLKHRPGYYSRRIDKSNRLVYTVDKGDVYIVSCKGHYEEED